MRHWHRPVCSVGADRGARAQQRSACSGDGARLEKLLAAFKAAPEQYATKDAVAAKQQKVAELAEELAKRKAAGLRAPSPPAAAAACAFAVWGGE